MEDNNRIIEVAVGSVSNRGIVIPVEDLNKYIKPETELYRSLFLLDDSAIEHFRDKGTIRSYRGSYALDKLTFDIDKKKDTGDHLLSRLGYFIDDLTSRDVPDEHIRIWFSGTGFHVEMPDYFGFEPSPDLPATVKATLHKEFKDIDNVYDKGRLMRVGYSYNMKSKRYKIPLTIEEISEFKYEDIMEKAASQWFREIHQPWPQNNPNVYWNNKIIVPKKPEKEVEREQVASGKYNGNVTCVQKMYTANKSGRRHNLLLRMVSAYKRMGMNRNACLALSKASVPSLEQHELLRIVDDVFDKNYRYSCNDPFMVEFCDPLCKYYKHRDYGLEVFSSNELVEKYMDFIQTDFTESSFNLKELYDLKTDYIFYPGELGVLIGDTKLGKTAFIQNIVASLKGFSCLYLSLEVHDTLIFRRFLQIANGLTKYEIDKLFMDKEIDKINELQKSIDHINIMTVSPEIDSMSDVITEVNPKIVVVDTIDAIRVNFNNDSFLKTEKIVNGLKQIAQNNNVIIIGVSHISKGASYGDTLDVHSAKGNSAIEQKADKIIGIMGDRDMSYKRIIKSLASRDETGFNLACKFNFNNFQFEVMK